MGELILPPAQRKAEIYRPGEGLVRVSAANHPVRLHDHVDLELPAGLTLSEILEAAQPDPVLRAHAAIQVGDQFVPKHLWPRVRPKPGSLVVIRVLPADKETLGLVVGVLVIIVGVLTENPALIVAGIGLLAGAIVALHATSLDKLAGQSEASPTLLIGETRNQIRKFGPIPRLFGHHRHFPDLGANQFTQVVDNKEEIFALFAHGYGPLTLPDEERLGETPLDQFETFEVEHRQGWPPDPRSFTAAEVDTVNDRIAVPGHFYIEEHALRFSSDGVLPPELVEDIDYWPVNVDPNVDCQLSLEQNGDPIILTGGGTGTHTARRYEPPLTLFPGTVVQVPLDIPLTQDWSVRTTEPNTEKISADVTAKNGLMHITSTGKREPITVTVIAQFAPSPGVKFDFQPGDVDTVTDRIAVAGHIYSDDQIVDLQSDGVPPGPLELNTDYYVVNAVAGVDFQLSLTKGGAPIVLTSAGSGNHSITQHDWSADQVGKSFDARPAFGRFPAPPRVNLFNSRGGLVGTTDGQRRYVIQMDRKTGELRIQRGNVTAAAARESVPHTPPSHIRVAQITRNSDNASVTAAEISKQDHVGQKDPFQNPATDFLVSPTVPASTSVDIAAGTLTFIGEVITANQVSLIRRSFEFVPKSPGQFDVRVRRTTPDSADIEDRDTVHWTALRSINSDDPFTLEGVSRSVLRIRATDQLTSLDRYSCVQESYLPTWNGSAWELRPSRNPAGAQRELLQGAANSAPRPDSRLDLAGAAAWHDYCLNEGFTFDLKVDFASTVEEIQKMILSAGRAGPARPNGKLGVIIDALQSGHVGMLTRRNSWGFSGKIDLRPQPDAIRVRFVNEEKNWQIDELLVFADGVDETNFKRLETAQAIGITNPVLVWRHTRVRMAERARRGEVFTQFCDIEAMPFSRGKIILLEHDVIKSALGAARITALGTDINGDVISITLDESFVQTLGQSYGATIRTINEVALIVPLVTLPGESDVLIPETPVPQASAPALGDLLTFGLTTVKTAEALIVDIESGPDLSFQVTSVPAAPEIHDADQGPLPALESFISDPAAERRPAVQSIRSDEDVLIADIDGSFRTRVLVSLVDSLRPSDDFNAIQAAYRIAGSDADWRRDPPVPIDAKEISIEAVTDGETYELRFRYLRPSGEPGPWTAVFVHFVIGVSRLPPDVPAAFRQGDQMTWPYPVRPRDMAGFQVRMHNGVNFIWQSAIALHPDLVLDPPFDIMPWAEGTRTFLVKAFDTAGNESETAAAVVVGFGEPATENIVLETAFAPNFTGVITGGAVAAGVLEATGAGAFWLGDDANVIWSGQDKALYWAPQFQQMTYTASYEPAGPAKLLLDLGIDAQDGFKVQIAAESTNPIWSGQDKTPVWSGDDAATWWTAGAGQFFDLPCGQPLTKQPYNLRLTSFAGTNQASVDRFTARLDVPDIEETIEDLAIAAAGTRLPILKSYTVIKGVELTLQDDGGSAAALKLFDKDPVLGPLVKAFDSAGLATTATIDATPRGYFFA